TPPSAARSARCAHAGTSLETSTELHRSGTLSRSGTPRWRTREKKRPHRLTMPRDALPTRLSYFSPPGNGLSTLDARWKPLIEQYNSGIIRGDTVGIGDRMARQ